MRTESPELLAVGILGGKSRVGDRVEVLLRRDRTFSSRVSVAGITVSMVVLAGFLVAGSLAPHWIAFAQQGPQSAFEVASIRPSRSGSEGANIKLPDTGRLFTALQQQLGLKLESARGPVEVLVIDHAENPDAN